MFRGRKEVRIKELDSRYSVSDDGKVWSGGLPLEPIKGVGVNLHGKRVKVAYLVARAFVSNGECRKYVRHKNGDWEDNRACNLEWSDEKEERPKGRKPGVRWCKAWNEDGEVVGVWENVGEAARDCGVKASAVRACLNGKQKKAGGLIWQDL